MEPIGTALLGVFRGTDNHELWMTACLEGAWSGLVGEKIAAVCRPVLVRRTELVVEVGDPDWLPALASMKKEMLARVRAFAGDEIRSLSIVKKGSR